MALQFSTLDRTAFAAQLVGALAGGTVKFFSGAEPVNCAASDPSGLLATGTLPATAAAASSGVLTLSGVWQAVGSASGTIASFRLYDSGSVCRMQGSAAITGSTGFDMLVDNPSITPSQIVTVATFTITMGNA
jgi:hypothetical protein